jgi:hypothetical protein
MDRTRRQQAIEIMRRFADRSGLTSPVENVRYLWTDAFAVCNWLALDDRELALRLIDRVHHTLGRHRDDDARRGWLSGLDEREGEAHPTQGGLRIGKQLRERAADEPFDERLEWERDGQYFHYLTRWMHALDQAARGLGQPMFNTWARELAATAHRAFVYVASDGGQRRDKRMFWKMSIDLSRPLVASMGHHDPLDGYVTYAELAATAARFAGAPGPLLEEQRADFAAMLSRHLATPDPLGLGGLLVDAWRVAQLEREGALAAGDLLERLLAAAAEGLRHYARSGELRRPAEHRLAFRELGLAIGLAAVPSLRDHADGAALDELALFTPLRADIEAFWLREPARRAATWRDHENINEVMLATSLVPGGYLNLRPC